MLNYILKIALAIIINTFITSILASRGNQQRKVFLSRYLGVIKIKLPHVPVRLLMDPLKDTNKKSRYKLLRAFEGPVICFEITRAEHLRSYQIWLHAHRNAYNTPCLSNFPV